VTPTFCHRTDAPKKATCQNQKDFAQFPQSQVISGNMKSNAN
jgi:hypothetical protein